jgi:DNA invertase Pin-like site-specific DNA recombinase
MKTIKRAAIYVRVSTQDQSTEMQERDLKDYARSRGWSVAIYQDKGESGAKVTRPALARLLNDARHRKVEVVLVWTLDRLARSLLQLLSLSEEFQSLGVDLVVYRQNLDTSVPAGRLTYAVLSAVAEFERELLRERVRAGLAQARRAGKRIGRPPLRRFTTAEIEQIKGEHNLGASIRSLAKQFGASQFLISKLIAGGSEKLKVSCTPETGKAVAK